MPNPGDKGYEKWLMWLKILQSKGVSQDKAKLIADQKVYGGIWKSKEQMK